MPIVSRAARKVPSDCFEATANRCTRAECFGVSKMEQSTDRGDAADETGFSCMSARCSFWGDEVNGREICAVPSRIACEETEASHGGVSAYVEVGQR